MPDRYDELCDIAECELCDSKGKRLDGMGLPCDHIDYGAIAKRGKKLCEQALKEKP